MFPFSFFCTIITTLKERTPTSREHKISAWGWQFPCRSSLEVSTWLKPGYIQVFCASAPLEGEGGSPGGR